MSKVVSGGKDTVLIGSGRNEVVLGPEDYALILRGPGKEGEDLILVPPAHLVTETDTMPADPRMVALVGALLCLSDAELFKLVYSFLSNTLSKTEAIDDDTSLEKTSCVDIPETKH